MLTDHRSRAYLFGGLVLIAVAVMLADIWLFGIQFVDANIYVAQIESWRHLTLATANSALESYRAFKPFYGIAGLVLSSLPPVGALLLVNAGFLIGLTLVAYVLLTRLGFAAEYSFLGTFWAITAYPALLFGFAAGTDISGWFFCVASVAVALHAIETGRDRQLIAASLLGFIGGTAKETGVLGLAFAGVYLLLLLPERGAARVARALAAACLPFLILEGSLLALIHLAGMPDFFGWFAFNNSRYVSIHTFKFFIGSELATFNMLWVLVALGVYALAAGRIRISRTRMLQLIALTAAALPVLVWPTFADRIFYIESIFVVPFALYGAQWLRAWGMRRGFSPLFIRILLYGIPLAMSIDLALIGGHDGLYRIAHALLLSK